MQILPFIDSLKLEMSLRAKGTKTASIRWK